jgi:hypothetical protein
MEVSRLEHSTIGAFLKLQRKTTIRYFGGHAVITFRLAIASRISTTMQQLAAIRKEKKKYLAIFNQRTMHESL